MMIALSQTTQSQLPQRSYANAISGENQSQLSTNYINFLNLNKVLAFLKDLLMALTTTENPKNVVLLTTNSFIGLIFDNT